MENKLIYHSDAMEFGYCAKGMRLFCQYHGFDYLDFVKDGVEEQALIDTNDEMALALVEHVRKRRS